MAKSPLDTVKAKFKDKAKLVAAVQALMTDDLWVARLNDDKGLDCVSNRKLLHLHDVLSTVKKEFGTRKKLIDALAAKDGDFAEGLADLPTPRLLALHRAGQKRAKNKA